MIAPLVVIRVTSVLAIAAWVLACAPAVARAEAALAGARRGRRHRHVRDGVRTCPRSRSGRSRSPRSSPRSTRSSRRSWRRSSCASGSPRSTRPGSPRRASRWCSSRGRRRADLDRELVELARRTDHVHGAEAVGRRARRGAGTAPGRPAAAKRPTRERSGPARVAFRARTIAGSSASTIATAGMSFADGPPDERSARVRGDVRGIDDRRPPLGQPPLELAGGGSRTPSSSPPGRPRRPRRGRGAHRRTGPNPGRTGGPRASTCRSPPPRRARRGTGPGARSRRLPARRAPPSRRPRAPGPRRRAGRRPTDPGRRGRSSSRYREACHGHSIKPSTSLPSLSGPPAWAQVSWSARIVLALADEDELVDPELGLDRPALGDPAVAIDLGRLERDPLRAGAAEGVPADHVAEDVDDVAADVRAGREDQEARHGQPARRWPAPDPGPPPRRGAAPAR